MTVSFPLNSDWIPDDEQLVNSGAGLLAVVGGALDQRGYGQAYARRIFSHGETIPWYLPPGPDKGQIIVNLTQFSLGRAGEEQFQFGSGNLGKIMQRTMRFTVEVVNAWPQIQGGVTPQLQSDTALMEATASLWRDGLVAWSALQALALGGVKTDPPVAPTVQDNILVGAMTPKGPQGGFAAWSIEVQIQF